MRGASTNSQEEIQNKKQRKKKIYEMHRKFNDYTHCTKKKKIKMTQMTQWYNIFYHHNLLQVSTMF